MNNTTVMFSKELGETDEKNTKNTFVPAYKSVLTVSLSFELVRRNNSS